MRYFRMLALAFLLATFYFSTALCATPQTGPARPEIRFIISMPAPHTHLLEVEMQIRDLATSSPHVDLVMPGWTPGSYLVRDYARHVQDFAARDVSGLALAWSKVNKNTWRIEKGAGPSANLRITYRVYANELTVRTNELNDRHAFWNHTALLMHPEGQLNTPSTVRVVPFQNWKVATGLPAVANEPHSFRAENFDVLYDSPVLVGDFKSVSFEVRGVQHRLVVEGEGNYDLERLRRDTQKIVETSVALMGDVPYRDYTFLLMTHPFIRGGLEHLNSTAIIYRRFNFRADTDYRDFLSLVAHEYFHLWNVKRIRPDALGPFDYQRENYTRLLWVAEGVTSYYQDLILRRAGLMTDKQYLDLAAKEFQALQETPGRLAMSLEEASFDAWIKYYRPDENTINSAVSYYDKGSIVARLLDLEIRGRSRGAKSLDDVMRYLYTEYAKRNRNYTPEDFQRAAELMAGESLASFFNTAVRGRAELDYNAALEAVGLRLETTSGSASGSSASVEKAYLGATLAREDELVGLMALPIAGNYRTMVQPGALVIKSIPAGTPAYEQGLNVGDQIIALDGVRATRETFAKHLEEKRPGDTVRLTLFRTDDLRTFDIKLTGRRDVTYRLVPVKEPAAAQMKIYQDWLAAPFPKGN